MRRARKPKTLYVGSAGDNADDSWPIFVVLGADGPREPLRVRLECADGEWLELVSLSEVDEMIEALKDARAIWARKNGGE